MSDQNDPPVTLPRSLVLRSVDLRAIAIEEARVYVTEALGADWALARVESRLVPGGSVGAPTEQRVTVTLDYHGAGRSEGSGWTTGPHLVFEGEADGIERAIAVAVGNAERHTYDMPTGNVRAGRVPA